MELKALIILAIISSMPAISISIQTQMTYEACSSDEDRPGIGLLAVNCEPREVLVKLNLPNNSYLHLSPDYATVKRCGGSCQFDR
jgi:hypothetical protein